MRIPDGVVLGRLVCGGSELTLVQGRECRAGPLRLIPAWAVESGPELVCLVPPGPGLWVESAGRRRTGAFLLGPNAAVECDGERWLFVAAPSVEIVIGDRTRCGFCRSELDGKAFLAPDGDDMVRGKALCGPCLETFAGGGQW